MNKDRLLDIFKKVKDGHISPEQAVKDFSVYPFQDLDFVKIDHHRTIRKGFPEVIFGENKKISHIRKIILSLSEKQDTVMVTRISQDVYEELHETIPDLIYFADARIAVKRKHQKKEEGLVLVLTAGTADIPVAEEAAVTAEITGSSVLRHYDVGVAGIHRLFDKMDDLHKARVIIVVAGMEGALPSVVAGLVSVPVIAVPTSIGYGASFEGLAPLLTMMNSCASGVVVVNIDNGFNAGYVATLINKNIKNS